MEAPCDDGELRNIEKRSADRVKETDDDVCERSLLAIATQNHNDDDSVDDGINYSEEKLHESN